MKEEQRGRGLVTEHAASVAPAVTAAGLLEAGGTPGQPAQRGRWGPPPHPAAAATAGGKDKGDTGRLRGEGSQRELPKWKKTPVVGTMGRTSPGRVGMGMQK